MSLLRRDRRGSGGKSRRWGCGDFTLGRRGSIRLLCRAIMMLMMRTIVMVMLMMIAMAFAVVFTVGFVVSFAIGVAVLATAAATATTTTAATFAVRLITTFTMMVVMAVIVRFFAVGFRVMLVRILLLRRSRCVGFNTRLCHGDERLSSRLLG